MSAPSMQILVSYTILQYKEPEFFEEGLLLEMRQEIDKMNSAYLVVPENKCSKKKKTYGTQE